MSAIATGVLRFSLSSFGILAALGAAETAPDEGRSLYDVLGGATWSERRIELSGGILSVHVDGVDAHQRAVYLSGGAYAVSGYHSPSEKPIGGILGLGASVKGWWGQDDVDVRAIAPFALGVAGVYTDLNERTRLELSGRAGPGLSFVRAGSESEIGLAWTWAIEAAVSLTKGNSSGLGVALGYESVALKNVDQDSAYIGLRFGF